MREIAFGRENACRESRLQASRLHRNDKLIQMNNEQEMAYVNKSIYLSLI
jgi:hypothetical protein